MSTTSEAQIGFERKEMFSEPLKGKSDPPLVRHAFCVVKSRAADWPKEAASELLEKLQCAIDKCDVRITACEALPGMDEEGDILVFPDFVRIKGALKSEADVADLADRLKSHLPFGLGEDSDFLDKTQVMVCAHTKRDARCGHCGPILCDEFANVLKAQGKVGVCDVRKCSHIGGHIYAGNVLVFRRSSSEDETEKDKACGGDWFGYVSPKDVPAFVDFCESDSSTYPPHTIHHLWRGRFGVLAKDHSDLCERVSAACEACTGTVRDMEDGVEGYPSPAVSDEKTKRKFISPAKKIESSASPKPTTAEKSSTAAAVSEKKEEPLKQARVVFVLGAPGSGKGTQCANLVRDFDLIHLSAGDLLRDERNNPDSPDGQLIETYIREGKIVPVAITVKLLWNAMQKNMVAGRYNFLIDGFPRNQDNLDGWNAQMGLDRARVVGVLFLDCPEAIVEARLLERGKTSGRIDDNISSIRKRFATFANETMPIVNLFDARRMCWKIDSSRPKDVVYADVQRVVNEFVLPQRRTVVFVLGGPGAGKGTQCANLVRDFDCTHLSAGDLLRAERADPNSADGKLIESYIVEGKIVPVEITVNLLVKAMSKSGSRNFLIDGFPRNLDNVQGWNRVVGEKSSTVEVAGVLFFDVPEEVMQDRLLGRAQKDGANARSDDNIETIKKRFKTFRDETMPIVDLYRQKNMVWIVSADRPVEAVYEQVHALAREIFLPVLPFSSAPQLNEKTIGETVEKEPVSLSIPTPAAPVVVEDNSLKIILVISAATLVIGSALYLLNNRNKL